MNHLSKNRIVLASASPRRAELLEQIGITFDVVVADIDETAQPGESPQQLVQRLAIQKAEAVQNESRPVLGADTLGLLDDSLLLKPSDKKDAINMLRRLSNRSHWIYTAVALTHQGTTRVRLNRSQVWVGNLSEDWIKAYWKTGEPCDKAGAYAIQGLFASRIVRIDGSYSGIMGLPLYETGQLLEQIGFSLL